MNSKHVYAIHGLGIILFCKVSWLFCGPYYILSFPGGVIRQSLGLMKMMYSVNQMMPEEEVH